MTKVFERPKALTDKPFHYCPGCTRNNSLFGSRSHRRAGNTGKSIGVAPVGCAVFAYEYFNCDMHEAAHGRAPAVATGIKEFILIMWCSPIRGMGIWHPLV